MDRSKDTLHVLIFVILSWGIKCFSLLVFFLVAVNSLYICSNVDGFGLEAEARMTTWHIMIPSDIEPDGVYNQDVSEGILRLTKTEMSANATSVLPPLTPATLGLGVYGGGIKIH